MGWGGRRISFDRAGAIDRSDLDRRRSKLSGGQDAGSISGWAVLNVKEARGFKNFRAIFGARGKLIEIDWGKGGG